MTEGRQFQVNLLDGRKLELLVQVLSSIIAGLLFPEIGFNKKNGFHLSNLIFLYPAKAVVT